MKIQGFQKMTLLDFPGRVACTIFTAGCNFLCPFCHNAALVTNIQDNADYTEEEILSYLKKRTGILDGVAITGGEPLLHSDIDVFIKKIRDMGYAVKLDSNGSFPDRLKKLVNEGLVDYVAMDIKNSKEKYGETIGIKNYDISKIEESVDFLIHSGIPFEFRTTIVEEFHTVEDIKKILTWIKGTKRYYLQNFKDSGELIGTNMHPVSQETLKEMKELVLKEVEICEIRGVDIDI